VDQEIRKGPRVAKRAAALHAGASRRCEGRRHACERIVARGVEAACNAADAGSPETAWRGRRRPARRRLDGDPPRAEVAAIVFEPRGTISAPRGSGRSS
jgi:hypothetical protein